MSEAAITFAPTATGYVVRIEGRGAINDAAAVRSLVTECIEQIQCEAILDLADCTHLDSTFLGTLVSLHRAANSSGAERFAIYLPIEDRKRLFGCCKLDTLLPFLDEAPKTEGPFEPLAAPKLRVDEFGHIVMESHQRLAELGGKNAEAFRRVADRIAVELSKAPK